MSLSYIRKMYGVPARRGGRVYYTHEGRYGTITSARNGRLRVRLDGDKRPGVFHPTWRIRYLDDETDPMFEKYDSDGRLLKEMVGFCGDGLTKHRSLSIGDVVHGLRVSEISVTSTSKRGVFIATYTYSPLEDQDDQLRADPATTKGS